MYSLPVTTGYAKFYKQVLALSVEVQDTYSDVPPCLSSIANLKFVVPYTAVVTLSFGSKGYYSPGTTSFFRTVDF